MSGTTSATSSPQPELAFLTLPFPRQSPSPDPGDVNDYYKIIYFSVLDPSITLIYI